ncbi:hypothetical protein C5Y96_18045 [Blastopirellula marina]|uniref:Uncharacterized protein n=1 Tax=Blastopirellula marina TaxID=124 RepID=A0A2S8F5K2_9BACT|nr:MULTISPECIES: hypothetical protein [Pirellulaceae]PQO27439.1 hypothetical protein C5Y96_18045 [Blastopirellula marina]RCS47976.1 hypothetical protein DTL36_18070 [Bremerella cremea]
MKNTILAIAVVFCLVTTLWGQAPITAPYEGVLVLTNGNAMRGWITREGEFYSLAINEDSVIRMPAERVAFACQSLEEAYLRQKARVGTTTLNHHIELANWCLGLQLWEEAAYHHAIAMRSGPDHPDVIRLDRLYQVKLSERNSGGKVETVQYSMPVTRPEPAMEEVESDQPDPSLSPQVVRYYTSTVQPIMLNSCAASRCHAENSENAFRLVEFENVRSIPQRMTVRNMNAALNFIDYSQPHKSQLLVKGATRHGDGNTPNLSPQQLRAIQTWVFAASQGPKPARGQFDSGIVPASFDAPASIPKALADPGPVMTPPQSATPPNPIFGGNANASMGGRDRPYRSIPQKGVPSKEKPEVRDEFDPELFNRKFHPNREEPLFPE